MVNLSVKSTAESEVCESVGKVVDCAIETVSKSEVGKKGRKSDVHTLIKAFAKYEVGD